MSDIKLTRKQELFCLNYFQSGNASGSAIVAGYGRKYAGSNCDKLLKSTKIDAKLQELKANLEAKKGNAEENTIANVEKRQQILTELATAEPKPEKVNAHARILAIAELNKMDHLYDESAKVSIDNRVLNIYVKNQATKDLILQVKDRTGKLVEGESE